MTRAEILDALCRMSQGQFDRVAATLVVPFEYLAGASAPQASRAVDMVRYLEAEGRLEECEALFDAMRSPIGRPEMASIGTEVNQAAVAIEITRIKWRGLIIIALIFMMGSALIVCLGLVGLYFLIGVSGTTALVLRHKARKADRAASLEATNVTGQDAATGTARLLANTTYRLALFIASVGGILTGVLLGAILSENFISETSATRISSSARNSIMPAALLPQATPTFHVAPSTLPTTLPAPAIPTPHAAPSTEPEIVPPPAIPTSSPAPSTKPTTLRTPAISTSPVASGGERLRSADLLPARLQPADAPDASTSPDSGPVDEDPGAFVNSLWISCSRSHPTETRACIVDFDITPAATLKTTPSGCTTAMARCVQSSDGKQFSSRHAGLEFRKMTVPQR